MTSEIDMNFPLHFSEEVQLARKSGKPIVALESTIISHGMPFPENLSVANDVENVVREHGAVPATIAVMEGRVHVGLNPMELESFANRKNVMKCSRRDLPLAISQRRDGATTVAATMIVAAMADIRIFATGGIGGVHRHAESTFDISADLTELSKTNVAVVSAGAKAILDLPKTLEYLETMGVPVIGFGTDHFPAFYSVSSGLKLPMRLDTPQEMAEFLHAKWSMGLHGGVIVANPIPEDAELDAEDMEKAIQEAILQSVSKGIGGKELTPFLLKFLNEFTAGKSQVANRALVLNNAAVAAKIAVALRDL